jgi:hypothetical protein
MRLRHLILLVLPLGGCGNLRADAPSLLPRPIEARDDAEPVATPVIAAPDRAFEARVTERVATLDNAVKAFSNEYRAAEARVTRARGAAVASDRWLDAQAALTDVGTARAVADTALADLEALAIERASTGLPAFPALDARIAAGNQEVERASALVSRLQDLVPPL